MRAKAREIQHYADIHDTKKFYQAAKEIYGPQTGGSSPLFTADGLTLLSDPDRTLERWKEHFSELLNATPRVNFACIKAVPQQQIRYQLDRDPSSEESVWAVKELQNGKAPGEDGIPAEILKRGGDRLLQHLHQIIMMIWSCEQVPSQLKDAIIVAIFKNKGSRKECGNYRGISLLSITGKVLTKIMQNRLSTEVVETNVSESQYGFRKNRGTVDMIFVARHIQEKCIEQNKGLFAVFIDLNKAFDSVPREALWLVLGKQGVPKKFLSVLRQFHSGMTGRVCANGAFSDSFGIDTGVKQGCCIAPSLFALDFDAMLGEAFRDSNFGINIKYRIDGGLFRLSRLQAVTKIKYTTFRDLLFADDCALFAHTEIELQNLMTSFAEAAVNFGLTVSIKKTEVLHQPSPINIAVPAPEISIDHRQLKNCQSFIYLGSILSNNGQLDQEINSRINKASSSFGRLYDRIWRSHDIKLSTKIEVYRAVVLTTLLYSAECWTVYRKHIKLLEAFQQRCLRKIAEISYKDKVSNQEVLEKTLCPSVESQLMKIRLRWVGHVARMEDNRMPKQILFGELEEGRRGRGRPKLRYKDLVKKDISLAGIPVYGWEQLASRREEWRRRINEGVERFENEGANRVKEARLRRKNPELAAPCEFRCGICQRPCASAAGLAAHNRSHRN